MWNVREGNHHRRLYYRHLQREERRALEWHASRKGCRLIVDPTLRLGNRGLEETVVRLETLLAFLEGAKDFPVEVVMSRRAIEGSLTLVGNWFVAESLVPRPGGYRQTVFNWHAPTVSRWVQRFDEQFEGLCRHQGLDPACSRERAIERIREILRDYRGQMASAAATSTPGSASILPVGWRWLCRFFRALRGHGRYSLPKDTRGEAVSGG